MGMVRGQRLLFNVLSGLAGGAIFLALLLSGNPAGSMELPRPGEIAQLKQTGEFEGRKRFAEAIGNNKIDAERLKMAISKAKRKALLQQGYLPAAISQLTAYSPPAAWSGMPTTGSVKLFALLIDFPDYPSVTSQSQINTMLFGPANAADVNYPYESLAGFYNRSSYGLLDFSGGTTLGWYRPAYNRSTISMTTAGREALIKEALNYFVGQGVNFSQFDNNGDGKIDYFLVIWTGPDNGWANFWWGYQTSFSDSSYTVSGKQLGKYSWQWEGNPYGQPFKPLVTIHETGHALGLPDYYDYNTGVGPGGGLGGLDMMDHNWGDHNCFSKWVLNWLTPTVVASGSQSLTLNPSATAKDAVLIMPNITNGDLFDEYYLVQNRYRTGNDTQIPTDGLLIWHVDATLNSSGTNYLYDNSTTVHKLLRLMEADGLEDIQKGYSADAGDFYVPGKLFGLNTLPSSKSYSGLNTGVNVASISRAGSQMAATFSIGASPPSGTMKINGGATATQSTSVTLSLAAVAGSNPIYQMRFSNDNASWSAWETYLTTKSWTIPAGDGEKTVYVQFNDKLGIESDSIPATITLDTVAPVATVVANYDLSVPTKSTTFPFSVGGDGVVSYKYQIDGGSWSVVIPATVTMNITKVSSGTHTLAVIAKDAAGNWQSAATPTTLSWTVDTGAPVTTATPAGGTYGSAQTVTLATSEAATVFYTTNGTIPTTGSLQYTAPLTITPPATLKYFAVDLAGNAEAVKTQIYYAVPVAVIGGAPGAKSKLTSLTLTVKGTSVVAYKYKLDSGSYSAETPIATKLLLTGLTAGSHTLAVLGKNASGGWQTTPTSVTWTVDTTVPVTTASLPQGIYNPGQTVTLTASEPGTIYYTTNRTVPSAKSPKYVGPITINTSTTLKFATVDDAGNVEPAQTNVYTITKLSGVPAATTKLASASLKVVGTGVSAYKYSLDGGAYSAETPVATTIVLSSLSAGSHTVSVLGKDAAGAWQSSPTVASWSVEQTAPVTTASPAGGTYTTPQTVTLTTSETATIYYTLNGALPTTKSAKYTAPLAITPTTTLKFYAVDPAGNAEAVKTEAYALPVTAAIGGAPVVKSKLTTASLAISGSGVVAYKYQLDGGSWSAEFPVATKISLTGLAVGPHTVAVIGKNAAGGWQDSQLPTTASWTVDIVAPTTVASPAGGTYSGPQTVTLTADEPATIYYTTNGATPSTKSAVYAGPISLPATGTLKFFAIDQAGNAEKMKSEIYSLPPVAVINGIPAGSGNLTSVTLTIGGTGIVSYKYQLDGGLWSAEIPVATKSTVSGLAAGSHTVAVVGKSAAGAWQNTAVATAASWTIDLVAPVSSVSPAGGVYNASQTVTISAGEAVTVYYTVTGTIPSTSSPKYTAPLAISKTTTLKYLVVDVAGNSEGVKTESYVITTLTGVPAGITKLVSATLTVGGGVTAYKYRLDGGSYSAETPVATKITLTGLASGSHSVDVLGKSSAGVWQVVPNTASWTVDATAPVATASPAGGTYDTPQQVTLSANEPATIYYTTNGATPGTTSTKYTAPITVNPGQTLKYLAVDTAGNPAAVQSQIYAPSPVATISGTPPAMTKLTTASLIVSGTSVVTYKYQLDGGSWSAETARATKIALTGLVPGAHTVAVVGKNVVGTWQTIATTVNWTVDTTAPVTTASLAGGSYATAQSVTLTANEPATIYYTTNGTVPTVKSMVYSGPLVIGTTMTLKYLAVDTAGNLEVAKSQSYQVPPVAEINGVPSGTTTDTSAGFTIGGQYVVAYKYQFDGGSWSAEVSVTQARSFVGLESGTHSLAVVGKNAGGTWQVSPTTAVWTIQ
ncbi:metalloprotease [Geotalea uraniireducens]|uniref:Metalloprotease n=1 Tax=Geotalea uraniireducens TaxID=351604 RepID=A0ABM8EQA0_9BACT|nr:chitobiase/beta-hexosaminidase C-terminal domain-containing protein [Geotalea uraniireducens]BDV44415.1 metalloprotease [Geotalea uraniireducens]